MTRDLATRAAARSRRRTAPSARPTARSSPSPTRTRRGRRTRCASSCARSPIPRSPTSAAAEHPRRRRLEQGRASTGATRWCCAPPSRRSARSPAATARSTRVRRADYVEVDPRFGHDLSLPYLMVQRGRRAVYEPEAHAWEKPTPTNETEYRRKVRMFEHCWLIVLRGQDAAAARAALRARDRLAPPAALRLAASCTSCCSRPRSRSSRRGWFYDVVLAAQLAAPRRGGRRRRASPATTCSSRGRRSSRSGTTCAAACRRPGRSPEGTR